MSQDDLAIRQFEDRDIDDVVGLWTRAGLVQSHNDPVRDIQFAMTGPASTILLGHVNGSLVGAVMVGHDGHRGTVYYLGVDPDRQKNGLGAKMLNAAEDWLRKKGVWKLNLLIRANNHQVRDFYLKCGYVEEKRIAMARRIDNG